MTVPSPSNRTVKVVIAILLILIILSLGNMVLYFLVPRHDPDIQKALDIYATQLEEVKEKTGKLPASITGPQGLQGLVGEKGDTGNTGATGKGEKGDKGDPGANGASGANGTDGQPGPPGAQGEAGPAGPQGEQGPPGTNGREIELRCNPDTFNDEYRYVGDAEWQQTGGKCIPG